MEAADGPQFCSTSHYWDKETRSYDTCSVPSTLAACTPADCIQIATSCLSCCAHLGPTYLSLLVTPYTPTRSLRLAEQGLLTVPRYHLERYSSHSFSVAEPILWSALPHVVRNADSVATFKTLLKTHLFRQAFVQLCSSDFPVKFYLYIYVFMFI